MQKRIRSVEIADAKAVSSIYAPFVSERATSFEKEPPDAPAMEQRIRELTEQYPWLVFEADDEVLGYAYASPHRARHAYQWCVDVSVYIHESAHRCGVGRALYLSLFEILRRQGYVNAYAGITLPNPASVGLHESLGFVPVGVYSRIGFKFGKWHDVTWLQLRLLEVAVPIPDPLPAKELLRENQVTAMFHQQADSVRYT
jgi:L-amino acid N-acyltransferase YncA